MAPTDSILIPVGFTSDGSVKSVQITFDGGLKADDLHRLSRQLNAIEKLMVQDGPPLECNGSGI